MELIEEYDLSGEVMINNTGCFGICDKGPVAVIYPEGIWYGGLTEEAAERIVEEHLVNGQPVKELII